MIGVIHPARAVVMQSCLYVLLHGDAVDTTAASREAVGRWTPTRCT